MPSINRLLMLLAVARILLLVCFGTNLIGYHVHRHYQLNARVYRLLQKWGDVTISLTDGTTIEGFVFDYEPITSDGPPCIRIMPAKGGGRLAIPIATISQVDISGRDMAAGKSFETWIRKYVEKKIKGESANIECESLDD